MEGVGKTSDIRKCHFPQMLPSVCNADCDPGFRKFWHEGMVSCCFTCRPCPENEVSNETSECLL